MNVTFINKYSGLSLDEVKLAKLDELDKSCNETILGNFAYAVNGTTYYFPNDTTAQSNFDKFYIAFKDGIATSPTNFTCYDAVTNGSVCRVAFDETSFPDLYKAHLNHIAYNVSKFRDTLEPQVNACTTVDQVNAITW